MAHLQEARRPIQAIEAEVKRLTDDLAAKTLTLEALTEDNRNLRLSIERTKGALEEREFLIRRLERSESNNANVPNSRASTVSTTPRTPWRGAPASAARRAASCGSTPRPSAVTTRCCCWVSATPSSRI